MAQNSADQSRPLARPQAHVRTLLPDEDAKAIVLQFVNPAVAGRQRCGVRIKHGSGL
jgi:hypothetical protein